MKKVIILLLILSLVIVPVNIYAKTISDFQREVDKYTAELKAKEDKVAKNDQEIAKIKENITNIENQIIGAENDIKRLEEEIEASNREIEKKTEESKKIMEYYQLENGDNAYLEYAFGAETITDMVYRVSIIEQLTAYNEKIMTELKELIERNQQKQKELANKKTELDNLKKELQSEKEKIEADTKSIKETMPSVKEQIKAAQDNLAYFKKLGCGANEDIMQCQYRTSSGSVPSTNGFYRPMENGYITQGYGGYGGHMGVDLSSSNKTIPIYAIASGVVFFKGYDSYGALVVKIKHNVGGKYIYSTYAHMSSFGNISVGQTVTNLTQIGNMGSSGYSTGPHLHLEITSCDWNRGGGCTWSQYQRSTISPSTYIALPSKWNNR